MRFLFVLTSLFIFTVLGNLARSADLSSEIPKSFILEGGYARKALGSTCSVIGGFPGLLPCNPAVLSDRHPFTFYANASAGNSIGMIETARDLTRGSVDEELVRRIFERDKIMQMDLDTEIGFRTSNFTLSYHPYRINYFSLALNPAYPIVVLHAMREEAVKAQIGSYIDDNWSVGLQMRGVNRKVVRGTYSLFDAATEVGIRDFEPQNHQALYLEPALIYEEQEGWKRKFSVMMLNSGFIEPKTYGFETDPIVEMGFALTPPHEWLNGFTWGLSYRGSSQDEELIDTFGFASTYHWRFYNSSLSLRAHGFTSGVMLNLNSFQAGLLYDNGILAAGQHSEGLYAHLGFDY